MTSLEQVIEVRQGIQKLDSNFERDLDNDEIVSALNKATERYIKQRIKPDPSRPGRVLIEQKSVDDIRSLITPYTSDLLLYNQTDLDGFIRLPADYYFLLSDKSGVITQCNNSNFNSLSPIYERTTKIAFTDSPATNNYYATVDLLFNSKRVFSKHATNTGDTTITTDYNYLAVDSKFDLIPYFIYYGNRLANKDYKGFYYEKINYSPNHFVFLEYITNDKAASYSIDFTVDSFNFSGSIIPSITTFYTPNQTIEKTKRNRACSQEYVDEYNDYAFLKTSPESPLSVVKGNNLHVYFDESFIVRNVTIEYIRKPIPINLNLNISCDLPEHTHFEICDYAIEELKLKLMSPDYQAKVQDTILRSE